MSKSQKGSTKIGQIVLVIILLGIIGYFTLVKKVNAPITEKLNTTVETPTLAPDPTLPPLVEAKRQDIWKATQARNYKQLAGLISSSNFLYLIGPDQGDKNAFEAYLLDKDQASGKSTLDIIGTLLRLPYTSMTEKGVKEYIWPDVFLKSPKTWTAEDWSNMEKLYSEKEIKAQELYWHGYVGYRIGIDQYGNWIFYFEGTD